MVYCVFYTCPKCKKPDCGSDPQKRANELLHAKNKSDARIVFNQSKHCRHMKICEIKGTNL